MFRKLFGKKVAAPVAAPPLSPGVSKTILDSVGMKAVPAMPASAQRAFSVSTNPKADAHDFIDLLEADESLAARVLKIANSVYYDRGQGSRTLTDAVHVIGLSELRCLLNANALTDLFPVRHSLRSVLWANDVATALVSRLLAQKIVPSLADQAFLAGLMHDVGKLLLLQRHTGTYEQIMRRVTSERIEFHIAEAEEYPFDHTQVGQLIAERWQFAPDLRTAIANHHQPWETLAAGSLASIVKAADVISHTLGLGHSKECGPLRRIYEAELPQAWAALNVLEPDQSGVLENARRLFEDEYEMYSSWCQPGE